MNKLTNIQIGYHAAAIDGEGCIDININKRNKNSYQLAIYVANTNMSFLTYLKQTSGIGHIGTENIKELHHKIKYTWCLRKFEFQEYLEIVINNLIIKKQQAFLMLEFLPLINNKYCKNNPPSTDNIISRELIWEEIKILNKRGRKLL